MMKVVPPHTDLATRIRRARNAAKLTQADLAQLVGTSTRTVQGWEEGRTPRDIGAIETALNADLTTPAESQSPRLDEATDAQLLANLAARLADRDHWIRQHHAELETLRAHAASVTAASTKAGARWAARTRATDDT